MLVTRVDPHAIDSLFLNKKLWRVYLGVDIYLFITIYGLKNQRMDCKGVLDHI